MLVQRWTRDAVLARMAAEIALSNMREASDRDRARLKLDLENIRQSVEAGSTTPESAALKFDDLRRSMTRAA